MWEVGHRPWVIRDAEGMLSEEQASPGSSG